MKNKRQSKILEIISTKEVGTQEELAALLLEAGMRVTQATISRDIREMKITKMPIDRGRQRYVAISRENRSEESRERFIRIIKDAVVSLDAAQNIIVIRTSAGMAMAVAAALDGLSMPSIVGSLAGDDTVFPAALGHGALAVGVGENEGGVVEQAQESGLAVPFLADEGDVLSLPGSEGEIPDEDAAVLSVGDGDILTAEHEKTSHSA